jgi:hypothetical protein
MYQYQEDIIFDDILKIYSQEDIMAIVFGNQIYEDRFVCSPFRIDHNPGCFFHYYNNKLWFVDFGDIKKTRDCFQVIMEKFNIPFSDLSFFISNNIKNIPIIKTKKNKIVTKTNVLFLIEYKIRPWQERDKIFWSSFYIKKQHLIQDKVYPIYWYKTNGFFPDDFLVRPTDIAYAINIDTKHTKIYRPFAYKRKKWFTNSTGNEIGNLKNISTTGEKLIITKSYKDHRILRNQGYSNTIWLQNETVVPSLEILYDLSLRYSKIYTIFDNDRQGKEFFEKLSTVYNNEFDYPLIPIFMPSPKHKDIGEFIKQFGEKELNNYLKKRL